jgi:hypothetical protein
MRHLLHTVAVASLVLAFVAAYAAFTFKSKHRFSGIAIDPVDKYQGTIYANNSTRATFTISNHSDSPALLGPLDKSCACTTAELSSSRLEPGEKTTLTVHWLPTNRRGHNRESVLVPVQYGDRKDILVAGLVADVVGVVNPERELLELSPSQKIAEVKFTSIHNTSFRLTSASADHPCLITCVSTDRKSVFVTLDTCIAGWESGRFTLTISTDVAEDPTLALRVRVSQ